MSLRNIQRRKLTLSFGFLCLLLLSMGLIATESMAIFNEDNILKMGDSYPQRDEYMYLPDCCGVRLEGMKFKNETGGVPPNIVSAQNVWIKKLGRTSWSFMHHFCAGINRIGRFERSLASGIGGIYNMTKKQRSTLVYSLAEFNMIEPPYRQSGSPLYAESVYNHAKALHYLGRTQDAMRKLKEGISAVPANDKLYLYLAQILLEVGDKKQAKKVLEVGYKRTNGSKKIGGMLSGLR